jgi:hypothetical protein
MAKPKKKAPQVEEAIAVPKSDRYASRYPSWEAFVMAMVPAVKYPTMHGTYLK